MFTHEIRIVQVANGWIVILPFDHEDAYFRPAPMLKPRLNPLSVFSDPEQPTIKEVPIKDRKTNSMSVFKTFPEVLEFLAEQMK